ncbi:endo-1,4-beta-xylanase [Clostridia bacterium]|nr:endo-1,4-beta-xylanase [Clostridia bacterium]
MKLWLSCIGIAFCFNLYAQDSVRVVKGQISDYYIPVAVNEPVNGHVYDEQRQALEGATVMFRYSPVHVNTSADGAFRIEASPYDSVLQIYYPGKEMKYYAFRTEGKTDVKIILQPLKQAKKTEHTSLKTTWFDPQNDNPNTYCNPLNIPYNFRARIGDVTQNGAFRSTADPMMLVYKGEYYLFSTNQAGFYWSKDLTKWNYVFGGFQRQPEDDDQCAPAAFVSGDTLFYTGSTYKGLPVWYSTDPKSGVFKRLIDRNTLPTWDPGFLLDDDGRLYEYYGSSNEYPLKGVEISRDAFYPVSKITDIMELHPDQHGWERFGMNNDDSTTLAPFMEGSWVNKYNGKYYFQYGAPGTEFKVYADGVYVSDKPLGPYTYQKHNPMSYKPGGFVMGAGHGGTFADPYGNYWHTATCMISLKYKFERRIGVYPAGFDSDGIMYTNTSFGDYPCTVPSGKENHIQGNFTGWMLLSYQKTMTASSSDGIYLPENASDENIRTFWSAASGDAGEWLQMDLGASKTVNALQINYYDHKADQFNRAMDLYYQYRIYHSADGKNWELLVDKSDNATDVPHDYVQLLQAVQTRFLKIENIHTAAGNFAVSDFRVFGNAGGEKPKAVQSFRVERSKSDSRDAMITWKPVAGAYGYNIYYGIAPDKMYNCITVNNDNMYDFRGLDVGTEYYFTIEALNESGRSSKTPAIKIK